MSDRQDIEREHSWFKRVIKSANGGNEINSEPVRNWAGASTVKILASIGLIQDDQKELIRAQNKIIETQSNLLVRQTEALEAIEKHLAEIKLNGAMSLQKSSHQIGMSQLAAQTSK